MICAGRAQVAGSVDIRRISAGNLLRHHIWMRLIGSDAQFDRSLPPSPSLSLFLSLSVCVCARNLFLPLLLCPSGRLTSYTELSSTFNVYINSSIPARETAMNLLLCAVIVITHAESMFS